MRRLFVFLTLITACAKPDRTDGDGQASRKDSAGSAGSRSGASSPAGGATQVSTPTKSAGPIGTPSRRVGYKSPVGPRPDSAAAGALTTPSHPTTRLPLEPS